MENVPKLFIFFTDDTIFSKKTVMLYTTHQIYNLPSQDLTQIEANSIDLVVTSPPYPMIEMWDEMFALQNPAVKSFLSSDPAIAFELMHQEIDKVWRECFRLLKDGGLLCINIGDATRTINKKFQLFNNHTRIVKACLEIGFTNLPNIIWRKQTNAPNKFMGSGMLPGGAYVTLEHEWILIFRKCGKRNYKAAADKLIRRQSAFFWEERNKWFSDIWDVKGTKQKIRNTQSRERNASFPLEIPFRLIGMYSQKGDTILDPFYGLGTTTIAAMILQRNSIGVEIDTNLLPSIKENIEGMTPETMNQLIYQRYCNHLKFIQERTREGKKTKYYNKYLDCKVITSQETDMVFSYLEKVNRLESDTLAYECQYCKDIAIPEFETTNRGTRFYKMVK